MRDRSASLLRVGVLALALVGATVMAGADSIPLAKVGADLESKVVTVTGRVASKMDPVRSGAPYRWFLTDGNSNLAVLVSPDVAKVWNGKTRAGEVVTVTGVVKVAQFSAAVEVSDPNGVTVGGSLEDSAAPAAAPRTIQASTGGTKPAGQDWTMVTPAPRFASAVVPVGEGGAADAPRSTAAGGGPDLAAAFEGFPGAEGPAAVTADRVGSPMVLTGEILDVRPSANDRMPTTLLVQADPEVAIIYYSDVAQVAEAGMGAPVVGQKVSVRGPVQEFRGILQVRAATGADLLLQGTGRTVASLAKEIGGSASDSERQAMARVRDAGSLVPISNVASNVGTTVLIGGYVTNFRAAWNERAPNILTLQDETGSVEVVFWDDIKSVISEELLAKGTPLMIAGAADEYRGRLQVKPATVESLQRLDAADPEGQVQRLTAN